MTDALFQSNSAPYANFPSPGTHYEGEITNVGQVQGRKYVPPAQRAKGVQGDLETWPDGRPKMVAIITVQTTDRDPSIPGDDGRRSIWIDGKSKTDAVKAAVREAGAARTGIVVGGWFSMTFTHEETLEGVSNPVKRYAVEYRPPLAGGVTDGDVTIVGAPAPEVNTAAAPASVPAAAPAPAQAGGFDLSSLPESARAAVAAMMAQQGGGQQ